MYSALCFSLIVASSAAVDPYFPTYHVRPAKNWNNDPNGPVYFNGVYHLFMQYNPWGPVWGNMSWAHFISADLLFWAPASNFVALTNNNTYDVGGVFSGSITVTANGPVISYTCVNDGQQQCLAWPVDVTDPALEYWYKDSRNPIIADPPSGIERGSFRDDTTGWIDGSQYYFGVGTGNASFAGIALYKTSSLDWSTSAFTFSHYLWSLPNTNMFECPDIIRGVLDPNKPEICALKFSHDGDHSIVGTCLPGEAFVPSGKVRSMDGNGAFYASKSFFDDVNKRQVVWGWVMEEGGPAESYGWQGMQSLPRVMRYNAESLQVDMEPIPELASLRSQPILSLTSPLPLLDGTFYPISASTNSSLAVEMEAFFFFSNKTSGGVCLQTTNFQGSFGLAILASDDAQIFTRVGLDSSASSPPENNTDRPGGDYLDYDLPATAPEASNVANCSATCANDPECLAWTYVRPDYPSPPYGAPRCSLKSSVPGTNPNQACCVSGTKGITSLQLDRTASSSLGSRGVASDVFSIQAEDKCLLHLRVFIDHSIVETFVNRGRSRVTGRVYMPLSQMANGLAVYANGFDDNAFTVQLLNVTVWNIKSISVSKEEVLEKANAKKNRL
jgi:sucrose-6-phosphate hydrolase SacC (GH32 family)